MHSFGRNHGLAQNMMTECEQRQRRKPKRTKSNEGIVIPIGVAPGDIDPLHIASAYADASNDLVAATRRRGGRRPINLNDTSSNQRHLFLGVFLIVLLLLLLGGVGMVVVTRSPSKGTLTDSLSEQNEEMRKLLQDLQSKLAKSSDDEHLHHTEDRNLKELEERLEKALQANTEMAQRLVESEKQQQLASTDLRGNNNENVDALKKRIQQLEEVRSDMRSSIELLSKRRVRQQWGEGPHQVEIRVRFPAPSEPQEGRIVVELAPLEEMPHAVHWFLEQVTNKLYDGCWFHTNANHITQGGPGQEIGDEARPERRPFLESGFDHLLYSEYSAAFPHEKYTLGYAGRPSGPDFYINIDDNSIIHGPGGQHSVVESASEEHADPCFARVVKGFDIVDLIHRTETMGEDRAVYKNQRIRQPVAIVSMSLLPK